MNNKEKTICFSGHRQLPEGEAFENLKAKLKAEINKAVKDGYDTFLFGGAMGWDLLCGAESQFRRYTVYDGDPIIKVIAVIPYEGQADKWNTADREEYFALMRKSDEVITLTAHYHGKCYADRNQYMVDHSSRLICYYDGGVRSGTGQTVRMAEKQKLEIINLYE